MALMEGKTTFFSTALKAFRFGAVEADYERKQALQSQPRQEGWKGADARMKCDVQWDEINSLSCFGPLWHIIHQNTLFKSASSGFC